MNSNNHHEENSIISRGQFSIQPINDFKLAEQWSLIKGETFLENMRLMATRIQKAGEFPKRLSITSALSGEGVTSVCLGIGLTLANDYQAKTCIVDLNWYSPSKMFVEDDDCPGISDILEKHLPVEEVVRSTGLNGLFVLPAGKLEDFKRPVVARSKGLTNLFETLDTLYDHIILDIPAVLSTSDAVHLAAHGEACCVVIRQGGTSIQDVKMALDDISHLPIIGVVVNKVSLNTPAKLVKLLEGFFSI